MVTDAIMELKSARDQHLAGKHAEANQALSQLCSSGPDPLAAEGALAAAITLLGELARAFGDHELAGKLDAGRGNPAAQALYDIAYALYEQRQFATASALLYRANALEPG